MRTARSIAQRLCSDCGPLSLYYPESTTDAISGTLVLAGGGVSDGRRLAAALALGADGVSVGTRMVATAEADAVVQYKQALVKANGIDTVRPRVRPTVARLQPDARATHAAG